MAKLLSQKELELKQTTTTYREGFSMPENHFYKTKLGLNEDIIREISKMKKEPRWMLDFRLKAYEIFLSKPMPTWGADLSGIDFDDIHYYVKPTDKHEKNWSDVPIDVKTTFDKLGIPQAEREFLSGVKAQYDSEIVYSSIIKELEDKGVIFMGTDEALQKYPHYFEEYFGKVIPVGDNKFAALNSAVWSGGSFIYIPMGVNVVKPMQAYFRINAQKMGQFERTLIIADEGSFGHYVEGCFTKDTLIRTNPSLKSISDISIGDKVLTHTGEYKKVYHTQKRKYSGDLYELKVWGDSTSNIKVTAEHPFLCVRRHIANERNDVWLASWSPAKSLNEKDYLLIPVDRNLNANSFHEFKIEIKGKNEAVKVPLVPGFFRLVGYYLAEGSIDKRGYLRFSFSISERDYIEDVKLQVKEIFGHKKFHEFTYKDRQGLELVFSSVKLARIFEYFGTSVYKKKLPHWMTHEDVEKQKQFIKGYFRGDGNYYRKRHKSGFKEVFRINTVSETLAKQVRDILLRMGILAFVNVRDRASENRAKMYTVGIAGEFMKKFSEIVDIQVNAEINGHKRATMFFVDSKFAYIPIRSIAKRKVENLDVYNFGVEDNESYVASVAVHNCSAPVYSDASLHSAVVEIIVKEGARFRYTTIQNWYPNVYNLVTKRAFAYKNATMEWVDCNIGSKVTMKYPSVFLMEEGARGEVLSLAFAGNNQHQHTGAKMIHLAPNTSSNVVSKSISKGSGRASYMGLVKVSKKAESCKSNVVCDALLLDQESRTDTYPYIQADNDKVSIGHEASVSKVSEEQLWYLMARGIPEDKALALIANGFIEPIMKELPMEYALEMNRLIELELEGSVG